MTASSWLCAEHLGCKAYSLDYSLLSKRTSTCRHEAWPLHEEPLVHTYACASAKLPRVLPPLPGGNAAQVASTPAPVQQPPAPPPPPPLSVAARHRLLSHCPAGAATGAGPAGSGWGSPGCVGQGAATAAVRAGVVPFTPGHLAALDLGAPSPAAEYRTRYDGTCGLPDCHMTLLVWVVGPAFAGCG